MISLMLDTFFENLDIPIFFKEWFDRDDWYKVIGDIPDILLEIDNSINSKIPNNVSIKGDVFIGRNVTFGDFISIEGPAYIGDNSKIHSFNHLRKGSVVLGDNKLGSHSAIKNSILMKGSTTGDYCYVGDSILGFEAKLGAHSSTLNQNFDNTDVSLFYKDERLESGLRKYGSVIGDRARLGGGVLTGPGSMVGKRTFVFPQVVVDGFLPSEKFVKNKSGKLVMRTNREAERLR